MVPLKYHPRDIYFKQKGYRHTHSNLKTHSLREAKVDQLIGKRLPNPSYIEPAGAPVCGPAATRRPERRPTHRNKDREC